MRSILNFICFSIYIAFFIIICLSIILVLFTENPEELNKKINEAETKPGFAGNFSLDKSGEVGIKYLKLYAQLETFTKVKTFYARRSN